MRKHLINSTRFAQFTRAFRSSQHLIRQNPKSSWTVGSAIFLASSVAFLGKNLHDTIKATDGKKNDESSQKDSSVDFEPFSDKKYQEALDQKCNVLIFVNPDGWADQFLVQIKGALGGLVEYQKITKGAEVKFFSIQVKGKEDTQKFKEKYKTPIGADTLFLLKNRYEKNMFNFTLEDWFEKQRALYAHFKSVQTLKSDNFKEFSSTLSYLDSQMRSLFAYIPKDTPNYDQLITEFGDLVVQFLTSSEGEVNGFAVTDQEVAQQLGLDPKTHAGKVFMLTKSSKYNEYQKTVTLNDMNLRILELPINVSEPIKDIRAKLSEFYRQNFTFLNSDFDQGESDYTLVLQVNENKIKKNELNQYLEIFNDVHKKLTTEQPDVFKDFKIIKRRTEIPDKNYRVFIQDNKSRSEDLFARYYNKKPIKEEEKQKLETQSVRSFEYEFPSEEMLTKENILKFMSNVKENKVPEYFPGQPVPNHQKYSTKIVESSFKKQILDVDKDHVMFICSKHCAGCKMLGGYYEQFALENLRNPNSNVQYNRINSERNTLQYLPNLPYTPVFMVLKKEEKTKPFVYAAQYGHPAFLKDFIDITLKQQLIPEKLEKNIFDSYQTNRRLYSDVTFEEIK